MRTVWTLAKKDLLRRFRRPLSVVIPLAFPLVFAALLQVTFGGRTGPPKVELLVKQQAADPVGELISGHLSSPQIARYFDVETVNGDGRSRLEKGDASALLVLPLDLTEALIAGRPVEVELIRNPAQQLLPEIAEITAPVLLDSLTLAADVLRGGTEGGETVALERLRPGNARFISPPRVALETTVAEDPGAGAVARPAVRVFLMMLPGISVYVMFLIGDFSMRDLHVEAHQGTLSRILRGPVGPRAILLAKAVSTALILCVAAAALVAIGWMITRQPADPRAMALLSGGLIVAATGLSAMLHSATRDGHRASTISTFVYLVAAFVGGSFMPLERLPEVVQTVAPLSLFYWPISGYKSLLVEGAVITDILPQVALLTVFGGAMLALGSSILERRFRSRGVA